MGAEMGESPGAEEMESPGVAVEGMDMEEAQMMQEQL